VSLQDESQDPDKVFALLAEKIKKAAPEQDNENIRKMQDISFDVYSKIEDRVMNPGKIEYLKTGIRNVDNVICGFFPGDYVILAARPSMGKTALAVQFAKNWREIGRKGIICTMEMTEEQIWIRLASCTTGIKSWKMREGKLDPQELAEVSEYSSKHKQPWIYDCVNKDFNVFRNIIMKHKESNKIDYLIVDYLQLMSSKAFTNNRVQELSQISRDMKSLAKELECPVIVLSQLSRDCEKRNDKRPVLSDLRDTGGIEQDADVVMFLYRESYYSDNPEDDITEVIIRKNRNGNIGTAELKFFPDNNRFIDHN
jgi:replicative DNA helicase